MKLHLLKLSVSIGTIFYSSSLASFSPPPSLPRRRGVGGEEKCKGTCRSFGSTCRTVSAELFGGEYVDCVCLQPLLQ